MGKKLGPFMFLLVFAGCGTAQKAPDTQRNTDGKILVAVWRAMNFPAWSRMISNFNAMQDRIHVESVYKGSYSDTMQAGIAAVQAKQQPNILQVYEVGTGTMAYATNIIFPVSDFMKQYGPKPFHESKFLSPVASFYSKGAQMLSMPFNSSTPIVYGAGIDKLNPKGRARQLLFD